MEYVVPCSTQSKFPYLWSAPLRSAHWMPIQGDPGAHEMGFPSHIGNPREHNWDPPPPPRHSTIPAPGALSVSSQPQWRPPRAQQGPLSSPRLEPRPAPPVFAPPLACSRCITSHSGNPQEYNWDPHPCTDTTRPSAFAAGGLPHP